jgi:hypothetical protein
MRIGGHERHSRQNANGVCACVWMTVAFAVIGTTGGLRPPLLCCGARVCRRKPIFAMYIRTSDQERRASARRGRANRVCNGNARDFRNRVRIPRTYHGGLTRERADPAFIWTERSHSENIPRGAYAPPALVLRCERLPAKNDFFDAQTRNPKVRLASARRGSVNQTLCRENRALSCGCRTRSQERRASARRGCANRTYNGNARDFRNRVRIPRTYHGGLTPPALVLWCERLPAKNDFFDAQTRAQKVRLASARRGVYWIALATAAQSRWRYIEQLPCNS